MSRCQLFWVSSLIFGLHQLLQKNCGLHIPFLHAYLDPFLSMPILFGLINWERRWRYGWQALQSWEIAATTLLFILLFEGVFPHLNTAFTPDIWDVPAYLAGAVLYGRSRSPAKR